MTNEKEVKLKILDQFGALGPIFNEFYTADGTHHKILDEPLINSSVISFLDSISADGHPDGVICSRRLALDIAEHFHPEVSDDELSGMSETEKTIALVARQELFFNAFLDHRHALRKLVSFGALLGINPATRAPSQSINYRYYISESDANKYLASIHLGKCKIVNGRMHLDGGDAVEADAVKGAD